MQNIKRDHNVFFFFIVHHMTWCFHSCVWCSYGRREGRGRILCSRTVNSPSGMFIHSCTVCHMYSRCSAYNSNKLFLTETRAWTPMTTMMTWKCKILSSSQIINGRFTVHLCIWLMLHSTKFSVLLFQYYLCTFIVFINILNEL